LFLDEVHHLGKDWSLVLKNLYDQFPMMNFVYSGSSMLHIEAAKGDLSRRQAVYELKGMSFREYLAFEGVLDHRVVGWAELLSDHRRLAAAVVSKTKVLQHFAAYLEHGFYPFYREAHAQYRDRLLETVNKVLEVDYPAIEQVSQETIRTTKKMLKVLAASTPQTPNMRELYAQLGTERNQGLKMLKALDRAGLLALVPGKGVKLENLSRPEKRSSPARMRSAFAAIRWSPYASNWQRSISPTFSYGILGNGPVRSDPRRHLPPLTAPHPSIVTNH